MNKKGAFLIELLLVLGISTIIISGVSLFASVQRESVVKSDHRQTASQLARQQLERVKALWQNDWDNLNNGIWHLELAGDSWELVASSQADGNYTKELEIESVYRDLNGQIASEAGNLDPSSKKIISTVFWQDPEPKQLQETLILTNYLHHDVWVEDSLADFSDGTEDATDYSIQPGSVVIAQTGGGGWTEPASIGTADGQYKSSGIWATDDYIYLTWDRNLGGVEVFDIQSSPATPSSIGNFGTAYRTNDCAASNGYLYVGNSFIIASISIYNIDQDPINPPYVGWEGILYQAGGLWATDDYLFVSAKNWPIIVVYQLSDGHYENPLYLGSFFTPRTTRDLAVSGNYLYVAQESSSRAVEIYDISEDPTNPEHLSTIATLYKPTGIWTESNFLYLSMKQKRGAMYSIESNPSNPQLYGYFETERNTADVAAYQDYGYIAGADSQLKVIEIFNLSDSKGISGTYFIYGEYISSTLETSGPISFYRLFWEGTENPGTNILFQTAVNNDDMTWNFVGPDGTVGSYFEEPGTIYFPESLGNYLRYKAILTGDGNQTPSVDKVSISYAD